MICFYDQACGIVSGDICSDLFSMEATHCHDDCQAAKQDAAHFCTLHCGQRSSRLYALHATPLHHAVLCMLCFLCHGMLCCAVHALLFYAMTCDSLHVCACAGLGRGKGLCLCLAPHQFMFACYPTQCRCVCHPRPLPAAMQAAGEEEGTASVRLRK